MKKDVLYSEIQRFNQWWIWLPLFGINGMMMYGVIKQVVFGQQFGDKPLSNAGLLIVFAFIVLFMVFFMFIRLETIVSTEGIFVRLFPFHLKYRFFRWTDVKKAYVRQYSPVFEYGGWGIKYSLRGKGKAFNVSGNIGLQIEFNNGEKLLIGTQNQQKLKNVLQDIKKYLP